MSPPSRKHPGKDALRGRTTLGGRWLLPLPENSAQLHGGLGNVVDWELDYIVDDGDLADSELDDIDLRHRLDIGDVDTDSNISEESLPSSIHVSIFRQKRHRAARSPSPLSRSPSRKKQRRVSEVAEIVDVVEVISDEDEVPPPLPPQLARTDAEKAASMGLKAHNYRLMRHFGLPVSLMNVLVWLQTIRPMEHELRVDALEMFSGVRSISNAFLDKGFACLSFNRINDAATQDTEDLTLIINHVTRMQNAERDPGNQRVAIGGPIYRYPSPSPPLRPLPYTSPPYPNAECYLQNDLLWETYRYCDKCYESAGGARGARGPGGAGGPATPSGGARGAGASRHLISWLLKTK